MRLIFRFVALLVLLLSVVCFVGCMAGIVGVWRVRQDLSEKTRNIASRVEVGLERASAANKDVARALEKASDELAKVNKEASDPTGDEKKRRSPTVLQRLIWQEVGPKLNDLGGRLAASSDAAVVVTSLLQSLQELPLSQTSRIKPEQLERWTSRSAQLSASLQKLQGLAGGEDNEGAAREVERVLLTCQTTVDEWQTDLENVRADVAQFEAELLNWMMLLAIVVTVVCAWVELSQVRLFAHATKWCFGRVCTNGG